MISLSRPLLVAALPLLLAGCFGQHKDTADYLARARREIAENNTAQARVELQNALRVSPQDPAANLALAKLDDEAGDLQSAMPRYLRAALPDARLVEAQLRVAEILIDSGRYQDASGRLAATLGSFPNDPAVLALRADLAERQNDLAAARTDAEAALRKDAANPRALAVLATIALRDKDTQKAIALVDGGLSKHPGDLRLLQVQAAALLSANQPDKAIAALRSITRAAPRNVALQTTLATVEVQNGQSGAAMDGFRAAVAADPANADMQLAFVKFLVTQSGGEDVAAYLQKLIAQYPQTSTYDLALAGYDSGRGDLEAARGVLAAGIARLGTAADADTLTIALARVEAQLGQDGQALNRLNALLAKDPGNQDALFYRADLEMKSGRAAAAIDDLTAVVRLDPVNGRAFRSLASAYLAQNEPKLAVEAMRRAIATMAGDDFAQLQLAAFLENAGNSQGARDVMARLTLSRPEAPLVWTAEAEIAIHRKDWAAASRAITRLSQLPDAATNAAMLKGKMLMAQGDAAGSLQANLQTLNAQSNVDPATIDALVRAAVAAKQPGEVATQLTQRVPHLDASAQYSAWLGVMALQMKAGQADAARAAFREAVSRRPKDAVAYRNYINLLIEAGQPQQAKAIAADGLAAGAPRGDLLLLRGWAEEKAGDAAAAEDSYRQASEADPLSLPAANNYANLLVDRDPKNIAALTALRARLNGAEASADPAIVDTIAWLDFRLGRLEEAKSLLTRIQAGGSKDPQVRFHLAAVLLGLGEKAEGLALLQSVKGLDFQGAAEAKTLAPS